MKLYNLTIMYDDETDEIEYIQETIDEEDESQSPIDIPESYTQIDELTDEVKLVMMQLALDENGGVGFA